ncbi:MAG TPA: hypothetical protein GX713_02490 [Mollicutes bacterium]|nr:hypothetical protein [Mollicutes bacterium]
MKKNNWIYKVFFMTFLLSIIFTFVSNSIAYNANLLVIFLLLGFVIAIGVLFDMIGTSVLTSNESSFHAMRSKKIKGSTEAINILRKKAEISNLCLDVFGDICGIVSGSLSAVLAFSLADKTPISITLASVIIGSLVSALTVGGKSLFKEVALKNADKIIYTIGKSVYFFKFRKQK